MCTKILSLEMTIFGLKMMMKSGLEKIQSCCCPEGLNWPGGLAGISEGASRISKLKILDHFSSSFLSQKCWFQDLGF